METISNPNFSIIVPSGCNAKCDFCFWKQETPDPYYLDKLKKVLDNLPKQFTQISLTGGEPTLSPYLRDILKLIDKKRFPKVVLTTNGTKLTSFLNDIEGVVDHVNISRHSEDDSINIEIFKTDDVPDNVKLSHLCDALNARFIDVTLSAVLDERGVWSSHDVVSFVRFANKTGANAVALRVKHGSLDHHIAFNDFSGFRVTSHSCPTCRHDKMYMLGKLVTWKYSLNEPSKELGIIYELVFNPNGNLTSDWEGKDIVSLENIDISIDDDSIEYMDLISYKYHYYNDMLNNIDSYRVFNVFGTEYSNRIKSKCVEIIITLIRDVEYMEFGQSSKVVYKEYGIFSTPLKFEEILKISTKIIKDEISEENAKGLGYNRSGDVDIENLKKQTVEYLKSILNDNNHTTGCGGSSGCG